MRSLAALHIHAMKIHRLLCNDRRRRPTGWIKSTLDYRLTLIDGSRYARFSKSLQFPKVLEILIISNESLSSSSSSFFDFVSPSVHLCRNKLEEYLRSVESFDSFWVDFNSSIFFILNLGWKRFENSSLLDISFYSCLLIRVCLESRNLVFPLVETLDIRSNLYSLLTLYLWKKKEHIRKSMFRVEKPKK